MASVFSPNFCGTYGNFAEASKIAVVQTDGDLERDGRLRDRIRVFPAVHRHRVPPLRDRGAEGMARLGIRPERLVSGGTGAGICSQTEYQPHQRPVDSLDLLYRLGRGMGRAEPPAFRTAVAGLYASRSCSFRRSISPNTGERRRRLKILSGKRLFMLPEPVRRLCMSPIVSTAPTR